MAIYIGSTSKKSIAKVADWKASCGGVVHARNINTTEINADALIKTNLIESNKISLNVNII